MFKKFLIFISSSVLISTAIASSDSPEEIIEKHCTSCHTKSPILIKKNKESRGDWEKTIDRMIKYGAQLSQEERETIINYLQKTKS